MPPIAFCTALRPESAASSDWRATAADSCAWLDTVLMRAAISSTDLPVAWISFICSFEAASSSVDVASTSVVVCATRDAVLCTLVTRLRNSSTV